MKDAKGHGSDKRGAPTTDGTGNHQRGVLRVGRPKYARVQGFDATKDMFGHPWLTMQRVGLTRSPQSSNPYAKAERLAQMRRVDNPDVLMRVR